MAWVAVVAGVWGVPALTLRHETLRPAGPAGPPVDAGRQPLAFEPNLGQAGSSTRYLARGAGYQLSFADGEAVLSLEGDRRVRMALPGPAAPTGVDRRPSTSTYLRGPDPSRWLAGVPHYAGIRYEGVQPGVDVVFYGDQRRLEYDVVVAPGADPATVRLRFPGSGRLAIGPDGELVVGESAVFGAPVAYQDGRAREPVESRYRLLGDDEIGFDVGPYDRARALVIDPVLEYSTYLGGQAADGGRAVAVDGAGNAYVTGFTESADFPVDDARQPARSGPADAFVTKLDPNGALLWSTYVGGGGNDYGADIAVDAGGHAYLTGGTNSPDFPLAGPAQAALAGGHDSFALKLDPSGSTLLWSTYLGGSEHEVAEGIAVDGGGAAVVTGYTSSADFPTVNAHQPARAGAFADAYVTKLAPGGSSLLFSTYLGGTHQDEARDVALDGSGAIVLAGRTWSADFPLVAPFQAQLAGQSDAFVARLTAAGALVWSTYLGGSSYDTALGVAVDAAGRPWLVGDTASADFPTVRPVQSLRRGPHTVFVTGFDASGTALVLSTYLGGSRTETAGEIAIDPAGKVVIVGTTVSSDFPTVDSLQPFRGGPAGELGGEAATDAFVAQLDPVAPALELATLLGGTHADYGYGLAVDARGRAVVAGVTYSPDFPTVRAVQPTAPGPPNGFVAKLELATPAPVIAGSTWYANGTKDAGGPAGTLVRAYATSALPGVPYRLVLGTAGCDGVVAVLNPATVVPGPSGIIGRVEGRVPAGVAPGTYTLCFRSTTGPATATGGATFVITA